jgi:hypothetical protein
MILFIINFSKTLHSSLNSTVTILLDTTQCKYAGGPEGSDNCTVLLRNSSMQGSILYHGWIGGGVAAAATAILESHPVQHQH